MMVVNDDELCLNLRKNEKIEGSIEGGYDNGLRREGGSRTDGT